MDPKRILILIVLLVLLGFATRHACKKWRQFNPRPGDFKPVPTVPATTPAPGGTAGGAGQP